MLATGDPSVAVVPDYYQKALDWDEKVRTEAESDKLGYRLLLTPVKYEAGVGLQGQLLDTNQRPVRIENGVVRFYHHARGSDTTEVSLGLSEGGSLFVENCFSFDGLWQIELEAIDTNGDRFVDSQVVMVDQSGRSLPTGRKPNK